jgi:phosphoribosylformylglycinamidine cyclo-ligase
VNDLLAEGAVPLVFLDYVATGELEDETVHDVVAGIARACRENGCALLGGETAEMPDIYSEGEFDLAGTIVGMVDRQKVIEGKRIEKDDVLLGFPSTGLHTNGYSLARKVLFSEYDVSDHVDELGTTVGEAMLAVHKSYLPVIRELRDLDGVHGFSHITGGGIIGNTRRVVPNGLKIQVNWDAWERPAIFELIQDLGNVPEDDMRATFNLGIGLIAVVDPNKADEVKEVTSGLGEDVIEIGEITDSE